MIDFISQRDTLTGVFIAGAAGALVWAAMFAWGSHGRWWRSDIGRNLMAMMVVLMGLFGLTVVSRFAGPLPRWIWTLGVASLDAVIWWRVIILWRTQREQKGTS